MIMTFTSYRDHDQSSKIHACIDTSTVYVRTKEVLILLYIALIMIIYILMHMRPYIYYVAHIHTYTL